MDMSTLKKKLYGGKYESAKQCIADYDLMFENCYTYNRPTDDISIMGKKIQDLCHNKLKNMPQVEAVVEKQKRKKNPLDGLGVPGSTPVGTRDRNPPTPMSIDPVPSPAPSSKSMNSVTDFESASIAPSPGGPEMPQLSAAPLKNGTSASTVRTRPNPPKRKTESIASFDGPAKKSSMPKKKELRVCASILRELHQKRHQQYAWPFYVPVDVKGLELHDYYDVIKKPMDLSLAQKNLDNDMYNDRHEFIADIMLIFENCRAVSKLKHQENIN
jgi:hypothetical protein